MTGKKRTTPIDIAGLEAAAKACRRRIIQMTAGAGSGHPGPSLSIVELLTALYLRIMRYDPRKPDLPERDRFVLSKGHAAPALYAVLAEAGFFPVEHLRSFRRVGGLLQGHPSNRTPGVDTTSGSLGLGLSAACGMALGAKMSRSPARVYAIIGDGETNEGQIWEAAMFAAHRCLDNLIVFTDRNRYQYEGPTEMVLQLEPLAEKWKAFGWAVWTIDGHDFLEILATLEEAWSIGNQPKMIIAQTVKGKGISFMEGNQAFHGRAPNAEEAERALAEMR